MKEHFNKRIAGGSAMIANITTPGGILLEFPMLIKVLFRTKINL